MANCLRCVTSVNTHLYKAVLLLSLFLDEENWIFERSINSPKVTQLINKRTTIWVQSRCGAHALNHHSRSLLRHYDLYPSFEQILTEHLPLAGPGHPARHTQSSSSRNWQSKESNQIWVRFRIACSACWKDRFPSSGDSDSGGKAPKSVFT